MYNAKQQYHFTLNAKHAVEVANSIAGSRKQTMSSADLFAGLMHGRDFIGSALKEIGMDLYKFLNISEINSKRKDTVTFSEMLEAAHLLSQQEGMIEIDTRHLLKAAIKEEDCTAMRVLGIMGISPNAIEDIYKESKNQHNRDGKPGSRHSGISSRRETSRDLGPVLSAFCDDLTQKAMDGMIDPVVGRGIEIDRAISILLRRTKSNPCLIGEAGVGKTAVVEGLAQRIADGDVPARLKGVIIAELSLTRIVAGAKFRGDLEDRVIKLIDEVTSRGNIILFIDEIHSLVGSGASEGALDCSTILKPHLARGGFRVIGATTIQEYRKHIEQDAALDRRFHEVMVNEVDEAAAFKILKALKRRYESYHNVSVEDNVLTAAVKLSARYIPDKRLPDKAIDLIDECCARACMRNTHYITENDVAKAVSDITGINVAQVTRHESDILLQLEDSLRKRVIGQEKPVSALAGAIRRGKAGLRDPKRPIGSFLFTGPTGVGKTELCLALAATLFQQKDALIRLDMSEYMEASSVSKMLGAAPGYIGYGDGGTLADNIRTKPYAVVLLDEIEKAHPDVLNVLLQILDAGSLTDSKGRKVSFQNTVIVMTSNVGARSIAEAKAAIGFGQASAKADTKKDAMNELQAAFRPEFLNRIDDIIVFGQLSPADVKAIAGKYIGELAERLLANGVTLRVSDAAITQLASMGFDERYGARPLKRVIQNHLEDKIADFILRGDLGAEDAIDCDFMDGTIMYKLSSTVGAAN